MKKDKIDYYEVDILIVEDNPNDAEMVLRAFRENHIANGIHVVRDGEEALHFIFCKGTYSDRQKYAMPKLILLDLKLPKVDGLEVLKKVKMNSRTKSIPVVMLTSSREEKDLIESYALGVNSYIVKPVEFDKFVDAVKNLGFYWLLLNQLP